MKGDWIFWWGAIGAAFAGILALFAHMWLQGFGCIALSAAMIALEPWSKKLIAKK